MRCKKALLIVMVPVFLFTAFVPTSSHAGWWEDIWKALYWLYYESVDHDVRITALEKQPPTDCLIESGRITMAAAAFPRYVDLNCFEETDDIMVVTSGWYHHLGANMVLTTTYSVEWETDHWEVSFNVYGSDGSGLSPSDMVGSTNVS